MDLDQISREGGFSRRRFLRIAALAGYALGTSLYVGCKVDVPDEVTINTPETGMISGRTIIPVIRNNKLEWIGASGAEVKIGDTGIVVQSKTNGLFGADNIQTGVHDIRGIIYRGVVWEYSGANSVIITRQGVSGVDVNLYPQSIHSESKIMYGKFYQDKAKTTALPYKKVLLWSWPWGQPNPGQTVVSESTTSSDGSYGFLNISNWERYFISIDRGGGTIKDADTDQNYFVVDRSNGEGELGVIKKDGYLN
jgi:hypothetical protein